MTKIKKQSRNRSFLSSILNKTFNDFFGPLDPAHKECSLIDKEFIKNYFKDLKEFVEKGHKSGTMTGFRDLDNITGGLKPGKLIVLGSRPGMGKTALGLNIALRSAINHDNTVAIFSLDLTNKEVLTRLISSHSKVDISKLSMKKGKLTEKDYLKITKASEEIANSKIFIDDIKNIDPREIKEKVKKIKSKHKKLDLILIDYLQLMKIRRTKFQNREEEMAEISRVLKEIAEELEVPVIVLSQVNIEADKRPNDKRPRLFDIRDSDIVQDADTIMFLYRHEVYFPEDHGKAGLAEIIVDKNRGGPIGTVELIWYSPTTSFENKVYSGEVL